MKFLILLSTLLLTGFHLHAEPDSTPPPSFKFQGSEFSLSQILNTQPGTYNAFRTAPPKPGEATTEINTLILKTTDCAKFTEQHLANLKKQIPGAEHLAFSQNNADFAGFAHFRTDPKTGALNAEFWALKRTPKEPFANVRILKIIDPTEGALGKLKETFPQKTEAILNSLLEAKIPAITFPRRRTREVETMEKPQGNLVEITRESVAKAFAGAENVLQPGSEFSFTIPECFAEFTASVQRPTPPFFVSYGLTNAKKGMVETISFANLSHSKTEDTRLLLPGLTMIVESQAVDPLLGKESKTRFVDRYVTEFNGLPAAVILTETTIPGNKSICHQYVILPRPGSTNGILVKTFVDAELSQEIDFPQHLWSSKGLANQTLASFSFLKSQKPPKK